MNDLGIPASAHLITTELLTTVARSLSASQYTLIRYPTDPPQWMTVRVGSQAWLPAFRDPCDAQRVQPTDTVLETLATPELLFLGLGLSHSQGTVFYDQPGDLHTGKQVDRLRLLQEIRRRWQAQTA